jgi:hypothetical protein
MSANTPAIVNPSPTSLVPLAEVLKTAEVVVASKLFPAFQTPQAAAALMLLCRSKGMDPMSAVERYHIVQGRPVMRADAMLAEFLQGGGRVEWHERTDKVARATFSHPQGGSVEVAWTIEQAQKAKLTGKDVWNQYPRQMLHARCVSEGVRSVFPGATNGLYTPEEAVNMEPIHATATVEVPRPTAPAPAIEAAKPGAVLPHVEAMDEYGVIASKHEEIPTTANGRLSAKALRESAIRVLGQGADTLDWTSPDPWVAAKTALVEKLAGEPAKAPSQPLKRTTPEPPADDIATLEDPFADN